MLTFSHVFTDGALYQGESELTIQGKTLPASVVSLTLTKDVDNAQICFSQVKSDKDGIFTIVFQTPAPSFDEHTITITAENETQVIRRVLFGELWFASGQSNMEMGNFGLYESDKLFDEVAPKHIRVFNVDYPEDDWYTGHAFSIVPTPSTHCGWIYADESEKLNNVTAIGLKFASEIYDYLNKERNCPVGILNLAWGGTSIFAWLPREEILAHDHIRTFLTVPDDPFSEQFWNKTGYNCLQPAVQYNYKIAPVFGLKCRSIIWYQGESDCAREFANKIYAEALRLYYKVYCRQFAVDPERFMMISSLIFPFNYTESAGDCHLGCLNNAFVETAKAEPDKFAIAPIGDLEPSWTWHTRNNPIHPANKYAVADRMVRLALTNVYGAHGQKAPVMLRSHEVCGEKLILKFDTDRYPIRVGDGDKRNKAHCLYVAGEDNIYLPAEYEILANDTLAVWCDEIKEPKHACYAYQSFDVKANIFAGEYPIAPFATDADNEITLETHRWYDAAEDAIWAGDGNAFFHPMWKPFGGCEVCRDTAFSTDSTASVRVSGDLDCDTVLHEYGAYLCSHHYNRLDFDKFAALEVNFYNADGVSACLRITGKEGEVTVPFTKVGDEKFGWARYRASFDVLPQGMILKAAFCFFDYRERNHFVNIEKVRLIKK